MKIIKTNFKYTMEIESNYKIGDKVKFIDKSLLMNQEGEVIGVVAMDSYSDYLISYNPIARGGFGSGILCMMPKQIGIFTDEQIRLVD